MEELDQVLHKATEAIEGMYFHLPIDGGDPVYRERVYCYELYHQMRHFWTDTEYYLNGEIDKSAHPILRKSGADKFKPDFLIHKPGNMEGNYAIIEVKHVDGQPNGIKKDIKTLSTFIKQVGYKRAIYLFYGYKETGFIKRRVQNELSKMDVELPEIELWIHNDVGMEAQHIYTSQKK